MPGDEEAGLAEPERGEAADRQETTDEDRPAGSVDRHGTRHEPEDHSGPTDEASDEGDGDAGGEPDEGADQERAQQEAESAATEADEDEHDEGDGQGLTDEARSRGGKHSSQAQERDEHGRFVGKD